MPTFEEETEEEVREAERGLRTLMCTEHPMATGKNLFKLNIKKDHQAIHGFAMVLPCILPLFYHVFVMVLPISGYNGSEPLFQLAQDEPLPVGTAARG